MNSETANLPFHLQDVAGATAIVVTAHPDDMEFFCGGTIAALAARGARIVLVTATLGDKGTSDASMTPRRLAAIRKQEARAAAKVLGVGEVVDLGFHDGEVPYSQEIKRMLAREIRRHRPHALFTFDPWKRYELHPDHRNVGLSALDARLCAKLPLYYPELLSSGLEPWAVTDLYLFDTDMPDTWIDVSEAMETRLAALAQHKSQVEGSWEETKQAILEEAQAQGARAGTKYAEGYKLIRIPGILVLSGMGGAKAAAKTGPQGG